MSLNKSKTDEKHFSYTWRPTAWSRSWRIAANKMELFKVVDETPKLPENKNGGDFLDFSVFEKQSSHSQNPFKESTDSSDQLSQSDVDEEQHYYGIRTPAQRNQPSTPCRFCGRLHFHRECPENPYRPENRRRAGNDPHQLNPANNYPTQSSRNQH